MEVVKFDYTANDIPGGLRRLADRIEADDSDLTDLQFVVTIVVDRKAAFTAYAWGQCSLLEAIGACSRCASRDLTLEK